MNSTAIYQRATVMLALLSLLVFPALAQDAQAGETWYVSPSGNDANDCLSPSNPCATINAALNKANFLDDTILVQEGVYTGGDDAVVIIEKHIKLSGGWNNTFVQQTGSSTIDGQGARIGIIIPSYNHISIENFIIKNGHCTQAVSGDDCGAGILNGGSLTLEHVTITDNKSVKAGGGISSSGSLNITDSLIRGNQAVIGGGIYDHGFGTYILNSELSENYASQTGGGIQAGLNNTIVNSSILHNTARNFGGGIYASSYQLILTNNTISGNRATNQQIGKGGGIYIPDFNGSGELYLNNNTITKNSALDGGGIFSANENVRVHMQNTILGGNSANRDPDCFAKILSRGSNLLENKTGCILSNATGDLLNVDPRLSSLTGFPSFHPLKVNSPAIDAGDPTGCNDHQGNPLDTDQRGLPRSGRCDIGAYEFDLESFFKVKTFLPITLSNYSSSQLFLDNFSDPASGWPVWLTAYSRGEYTDGEYWISVWTEDYLAAAHPGIRATDYIASVSMRHDSGGSGGIAFGIDEDFNTFYTLEIWPEGYFYLYRYDPTEIKLLYWAFSPALNQDKQTNEIKIVRNGSTIKAFANGYLMANISDDKYSDSRYIGLFAQGYSSIYFDNFHVDPLEVNGSGTVFADNNSPMRADFREVISTTK